MDQFTRLTATACPLPIAGIDTDQLIPARFLNLKRSESHAPVLLHDLRKLPDFPLEDPAYAGAQIIVARRNFGGGSSREAAVYALADYGIRCVVAPSFGDIFAANAVNNGLLPATVTEAHAEEILQRLQTGTKTLTIDLENAHILAGNQSWSFTIDPVWREKLLHGWDDIDLTRTHTPAINAFAESYQHQNPWSWL
jgi:3-isopropylmalate/(R)-2-methylmalate dehydratase small subunit